jgi:hypothetical protein
VKLSDDKGFVDISREDAATIETTTQPAECGVTPNQIAVPAQIVVERFDGGSAPVQKAESSPNGELRLPITVTTTDQSEFDQTSGIPKRQSSDGDHFPKLPSTKKLAANRRNTKNPPDR